MSALSFHWRRWSGEIPGYGFQCVAVFQCDGTQLSSTLQPAWPRAVRKEHNSAPSSGICPPPNSVNRMAAVQSQRITTNAGNGEPSSRKDMSAFSRARTASHSARKEVWSSLSIPAATWELREGMKTDQAPTSSTTEPSVATKMVFSSIEIACRISRFKVAAFSAESRTSGGRGNSWKQQAPRRSSARWRGARMLPRRSAVWGHCHNKCGLLGQALPHMQSRRGSATVGRSPAVKNQTLNPQKSEAWRMSLSIPACSKLCKCPPKRQ